MERLDITKCKFAILGVSVSEVQLCAEPFAVVLQIATPDCHKLKAYLRNDLAFEEGIQIEAIQDFVADLEVLIRGEDETRSTLLFKMLCTLDFGLIRTCAVISCVSSTFDDAVQNAIEDLTGKQYWPNMFTLVR